MNTFRSIPIGGTFIFENVWYIKIAPQTGSFIGDVWNAVMFEDRERGRWFEQDEMVFLR